LQDFSFELSYYLNYYYFLLWGGLDQVCWIANEACGLGFTAKNAPAVGIQKKEFGRCLERQAPEVAEEFAKSAFVEWLNRLKLIRHHSSHQGFPMLTTLFEAPAITPNQEQMDSEIEAWPEWLEAKEMLGPELLEASRAVFRNKWIEKNCRLISDAVLGVPDDKGFSAVSPLQHITEDFKIFQDFVLRVTELCVNRLSTNTPTP
jgi:hypothetical protein